MTFNKTFTDIALYLGRLPVPSTEMRSRKPLRKMHLDAWLAELQVIMLLRNWPFIFGSLTFGLALGRRYWDKQGTLLVLRRADNAWSVDLCHDVNRICFH